MVWSTLRGDVVQLQRQIAELYAAQRAGKSERAAQLWTQIKQANVPLDERLLVSLAELAVPMGEHGYALALWMRAIDAAPDDVGHLNRATNLLLALGRNEEARTLIDRALTLDPKSATALRHKGVVLLAARCHRRGMEVLEQAKGLQPRDAAILVNLAVAQNFCGYPERALENAQLASRIEARNAFAHATVGKLRAEAGDRKAALAAYEKGLRAQESSGPCHHGIATLTKFGRDDLRLVERMEAQLGKSLEPNDRALIHMALGKAYDDLGEYERAFGHFRVGNALRKPPALPRGHDELLAFGRTCAALGPLGDPPATIQPIFIVGMPRSGSTLVEQILARHPRVGSAGELSTLSELVDECIGPFDTRTDFSTRLTPAVLGEIRRRYLARLGEGKSGVARVIDKAPGNHVFIGLIRLLFPRAVIVHSIRHPLDTCLSCHVHDLSAVPWTTDLEWIALHYGRYRALMDYWARALPDARVVDIEYERLVENPERVVRDLLVRADLAWDPRCLDPTASTESVRTASLWQVRQPIYRTSVRRWVGYARHLQPLADGLKRFLNHEDLETLRAHGVNTGSRTLDQIRGLFSRQQTHG